MKKMLKLIVEGDGKQDKSHIVTEGYNERQIVALLLEATYRIMESYNKEEQNGRSKQNQQICNKKR